MFKNMKVSMLLGMGFGLVLIFLCMISFIGIMKMAGLNTNIDLLVHDRYPKTVLTNDVHEKVNAINIAMLTMVLEKDPAKEKTARYYRRGQKHHTRRFEKIGGRYCLR